MVEFRNFKIATGGAYRGEFSGLRFFRLAFVFPQMIFDEEENQSGFTSDLKAGFPKLLPHH